MRTVRFHQHGDPDVLVVAEVDVPCPGPGQVLLRTELVAGSFVDTTMRRGDGPFGPGPLPSSPHGEVVGIVEALGDGVDDGLRGRRMAALVFAEAYADAVLADAAACVPVPDALPAPEASVLAMAAPVAMAALALGRLAPGDTVLVQAAAGSIGHLAVQVARLLGASRVVGVVGRAAKLDVVRDLGAEAVALDDDWTGEVSTLVPGGVDLALDSAGGQISADTLELLDPFGRLVVYGAASGALPSIPARPLLTGRSVTGFGIGTWQAAHPDEAARHLAMVTGWLASGELRVLSSAPIPLAEARRAHALLEDRARVGRVVVGGFAS
jgi:NADPH2:quinone reductase